jgi:hypothetical protein
MAGWNIDWAGRVRTFGGRVSGGGARVAVAEDAGKEVESLILAP